MRRAALLLTLALAACSNDAPAPIAEAEPAPAWAIYVCQDGRIVQALYPDSRTARVRMPDGEHLLKVAGSGSGARYVGAGLQWWTKGDEGMLAPLKPGEDIAAAPGVACVPPGRAPVEPPEPGTPGGLPDDRTALDERPSAPGSGQAAARVVETYFALVESGRSAEAAKLRRDGQVYDVRPFARLNALIGGPRRVEGAAGSLYVDVPVVLYGRYATGGEYHASGKAILRRANDTPGATAEPREWRIEAIEVKTAP
jgi:membrane-bound inhibitor of C-type lysozyme